MPKNKHNENSVATETIQQDKADIGNRDSKGRFKKGVCGNPKGYNSQARSFIENLIEALESASKRLGYKDFASVVSTRALTSDTVLIAVLRKIVPDRVATEGDAIKFINLIYGHRERLPNSPIRDQEQPR